MEKREEREYIKKEAKKKKSLEEISKGIGKSKEETIGIVEIMKEEGEIIDYVKGEIVLTRERGAGEIEIPKERGEIKFLAISDIHYGSKYDHPEIVEEAYERAEREGCQFVTNSGDIFEGDFKGKRPNHIYEVKAHGLEQLDYVIEKYPRSAIPTYYITGNHCATFTKTCGVEIGKMLERERKDLTYLGQDIGDIKIGKVKIRLRHGIGGNAYAKGYKLQKYCEGLPTKDLPSIILQGHYHYSAYFKNRDIYCFNVPAMQGYTPYAKSLGLPEEIGYYIITAYIDERGEICHIVPELYQFTEKKKGKSKVLQKR